ncbi:MAG: ParB/RepB/Spo0J family partition protein [Eubacteriales bacterium]|nr:ParB/RepB/Spo0J family partition protein [Eubacteriales bacterium]
MAKRGLGRGLDALLPEISTNDGIEEIDLELLDPMLDQPRQSFDDDSISELAQSIKQEGVISPLIVIKMDDRYSIVAGERRFRASKLAGLNSVPCIVKDLSDEQIYKLSLIENIQREDLNPIDEAEAYQRLIEKFRYTQEQLAEGLGKSRSSIANSLRLNKLSEAVKQSIRDSKISLGHAKVLAGLNSKELQEKLCRRIVNENLSVRELEAVIKQKPVARKSYKDFSDPELMAFERSLKSKLGLKAAIKGNMQKGRIILTYSNTDELNTIYNIFNSADE